MCLVVFGRGFLRTGGSRQVEWWNMPLWGPLWGIWVCRTLRGGAGSSRERSPARRLPRARKAGKCPVLLSDFPHRSCCFTVSFSWEAEIGIIFEKLQCWCIFCNSFDIEVSAETQNGYFYQRRLHTLKANGRKILRCAYEGRLFDSSLIRGETVIMLCCVGMRRRSVSHFSIAKMTRNMLRCNMLFWHVCYVVKVVRISML